MNSEYDSEQLKTEDACNIVGNKCLTHRTCEGAQNEISKVHTLRKELINEDLKHRKIIKLMGALNEFDKLVYFLEENMSFPEYPQNIKKLNEYRELINELKEGS